MGSDTVDTVRLNNWVERMRKGDLSAREELLKGVCGRLERLARKMLHQYPSAQVWAETGDILQSSVMRLLRALEEVQPTSVRDFFGLAAEQMRRELLDLVRRFKKAPRNQPEVAQLDAVSPGSDGDDLQNWSTFHEEVSRLPAEEREVVGLVFYHGWTQAEVAELFQVDVRTVQRRWRSAVLKLQAKPDDDLS